MRRSVVLPFSHNGGGTVTARLHSSDDLAADNTAWAVLPPPRKIAVTLVSPGNLFLEKVLQTDPQVALDVKTPDQYQGGMGEADVVVLDSVTPPKVGPGRFIFVNTVPRRRADRGARAGSSARPSWTGTGRIPIMRHVEFAKVAIEDAMRHPAAGGRPAARRGGGRPAHLRARGAGSQGRLRGLRPVQDRLPAAGGVPADPVQHAALAAPGRRSTSRACSWPPGQPILLPVAHGITSATVTTPSGRTVKAPVTRGAVSFTETDEVGLYTLSTARGDLRIAVNLMDADESNLDAAAAAGRPQGAAESAAMPVPLQRELWPLFVALAAVLLALGGRALLAPPERRSAGPCRPAPATAGRSACAAPWWSCSR